MPQNLVPLLEQVRDPWVLVRIAALEDLGEALKKEGIPRSRPEIEQSLVSHLRQIISDEGEDFRERIAALSTAGRLTGRARELVPMVFEAMRVFDFEVRDAAEEALVALRPTEQELVGEVREALSTGDGNLLLRLAEVTRRSLGTSLAMSRAVMLALLPDASPGWNELCLGVFHSVVPSTERAQLGRELRFQLLSMGSEGMRELLPLVENLEREVSPAHADKRSPFSICRVGFTPVNDAWRSLPEIEERAALIGVERVWWELIGQNRSPGECAGIIGTILRRSRLRFLRADCVEKLRELLASGNEDTVIDALRAIRMSAGACRPLIEQIGHMRYHSNRAIGLEARKAWAVLRSAYQPERVERV